MDASIKPYAHYDRLVKKLAFQIVQRLHAAGAKSLQIEDVQQEVAETWCRCRDGYDSTKTDASFVTYFCRAAMQNANRSAETGVLRHVRIETWSLDAPMSSGGPGGSVSAGPRELHEITPDTAESIETVLLRAERIREVMTQLTPSAQKFVTILMNPPPALFAGVDQMQARAKYGRDRGLDVAAPKRVTARMIFNLMGLSHSQRIRIYRQIRAACAHLELDAQ